MGGFHRYECKNLECKTNISLIKAISPELPKIKLSSFLFCCYLYSTKAANYQAVIMSGLSEHSWIDIKKIILFKLYDFTHAITKIGGVGETLQIDETACNRRRLITSPTSEEEYIRDTVWVIGAACERTNKSNCVYWMTEEWQQLQGS